MNPLIYKFPLDTTGTASKNRILGEYHDISKYAALPYRPVVLNYGVFYVDSLSITDSAGYTLKAGVDFQTTGLNAEASTLTGLEAYSIVIIVNPNVTSILYVDYNVVGERFTDVSSHISDMAVTLLNDTRSVNWWRLKDKPDAYPGAGHLHGMWDLWGFEPFRDRIGEITTKVITKSATDVGIMTDELNANYTNLEAARQYQLDYFQTHKDDTENPHRVTAIQVGLGQLKNYPIASEEDVRVKGGWRNDRYMTPLRVAQLIEENFTLVFQHHAEVQSNPHRLTAAQVSVYTHAEMSSVYNTLLARTQQAERAASWEGRTPTTLINDTTIGMSTDVVSEGRFPVAQLGTGATNNEKILTGAGEWIDIAGLISTVAGPSSANLIYSYNSSPEAIKETYKDVPVGTIIIYQASYYQHFTRGNGGMHLTTYRPMHAMEKLTDGWLGPLVRWNAAGTQEEWTWTE